MYEYAIYMSTFHPETTVKFRVCSKSKEIGTSTNRMALVLSAHNSLRLHQIIHISC